MHCYLFLSDRGSPCTCFPSHEFLFQFITREEGHGLRRLLINHIGYLQGKVSVLSCSEWLTIFLSPCSGFETSVWQELLAWQHLPWVYSCCSRMRKTLMKLLENKTQCLSHCLGIARDKYHQSWFLKDVSVMMTVKVEKSFLISWWLPVGWMKPCDLCT